MTSIVGAFAMPWIGYFCLMAVLPIRYDSVELSNALSLLVIFVVMTAGCATLLGAFHSAAAKPQDAGVLCAARPLDRSELNHIVMLGLVLSGVGLALLAYVRVSVQGIDYSQGLAVARELWRVEGEARSGVSSPLSIPGYALAFFFFASTFLGHLHWEYLSRWSRCHLVVGGLLLVVGHSVLSGGRSVLLLQLVSVVGVAVIRKAQDRKSFPGRFWRGALFATVSILAAISYFLYVFSERAIASGVPAEAYAQSAIAFMGAAPTEVFLAIPSLPEPLASLTHFCVIAGAYATHSVGTIASVMEYSSHQGVATFVGAREFLAAFGLMHESEGWVLAGAFLSLPGALWYDFGVLGVLAGAGSTGAALAGVGWIIRNGSGGGISVGFAAATLITAAVSPLIFALDSLAFPFMVLGYLGLASYSHLVFGSRNWWKVGRRCCLLSVA